MNAHKPKMDHRWNLTIVILITFAVVVEGLYVPSSSTSVSSSEETPEGSGENMWVPPGGIPLNEFIGCNGMPCEQWHRTQAKISQILQIQYQLHNENADSDSRLDPILPINGTLDGCIYLTEDQTDEILEQLRGRGTGEANSDHHRQKRKINNSSFSRWPIYKPIVYKFSGEHNPGEQQIVRNAFQHWEDNTCIRFQEVPTNQQVDDYHVLLTAGNTGCHAYVGRVGFRPQTINLMASCLWWFGIPVHEIGHTLGLWHEQQRPDRDDYITVMYENIAYYAGQYTIKLDTGTLGVPYDHGSVMHYAPYDGSDNGQPAMIAKDPNFQQSMGQRVEASWYDIKIINRAYCSGVCTNTLPQPCQRDGYQDPKHCYRCKCPPGFTGTYCQQLAPAYGDPCGGELTAIPGVVQEFTSPGYYTIHQYQYRQECSWRITAPANHRVQLYFEDEFGVYCHYQGQCYHWVEVQASANIGMPGYRFCCNRTPDVRLLSETEEMVVLLKGNWTTYNVDDRRGFKAKYIAKPVTSGSPTTTTTSTTTTPTTTTTSTTTTSTTTSSDSFSWWCGFEGDNGAAGGSWCGMEQEQFTDNFDWTLQTGGTPSGDTGPSRAYSGQYYIYMEASNPRRSNDVATIYLPRFGRTGEHCLWLSYSMYGFHVRGLQVVLEKEGYQTVVWSQYGDKGRDWFSDAINIDLTNPNYRVGFKGIRGDEFSGDIAIDHIFLVSGRC